MAFKITNHRTLLLILIGVLVNLTSCKDSTKAIEEENNTAELSIKKYEDRFEHLLNYPVDSLSFPRSATNGDIKKVPSKDWTSGFFPGSLWMIGKLTGEKRFFDQAKKWTALIEKEKWNDRTHDMGFKVFSSYGNAYKLVKDEEYKSIIIQSAKTLNSRFNTTIGCTRSWDFNKETWMFPVIIDNMMNLELLFEATRLTEDSIFHKNAHQHANTTLKNHFRDDHSSYHVVDYDTITGKVRSKVTHQGFSDESSWSRGQAWAIYGFTLAYRYTRDTEFLEQAKNTAFYFINHNKLPEDGIPYWDFDAPNQPNEPRDASAAAVVASALIELYTFSKEPLFLAHAKKTIENLSSKDYVIQKDTDIPFIINHSTGNWPKNDEIDGPISYADYYFLEALVRWKELEKP